MLIPELVIVTREMECSDWLRLRGMCPSGAEELKGPALIRATRSRESPNLKSGKSGGRLGVSVVECLPLAQGMILGSRDPVPDQAPCEEPASPSACVSASLSLSVSLMNK